MRNITLVLSVTTALLSGCLAAGQRDRIAVPPVRPGTNPARWEYRCLAEQSAESLESKANQLGAAGFELANAVGRRYAHLWCFKRRMP